MAFYMATLFCFLIVHSCNVKCKALFVSYVNVIISFQTFERADKVFWETLVTEWEQEKQKILNALIGPSHELMDISTENKVKIDFVFELNIQMHLLITFFGF